MTVQQLAHAPATVAIDGSTTRGRLKTVAALQKRNSRKNAFTTGSKNVGRLIPHWCHGDNFIILKTRPHV